MVIDRKELIEGHASIKIVLILRPTGVPPMLSEAASAIDHGRKNLDRKPWLFTVDWIIVSKITVNLIFYWSGSHFWGRKRASPQRSETGDFQVHCSYAKAKAGPVWIFIKVSFQDATWKQRQQISVSQVTRSAPLCTSITNILRIVIAPWARSGGLVLISKMRELIRKRERLIKKTVEMKINGKLQNVRDEN